VRAPKKLYPFDRRNRESEHDRRMIANWPEMTGTPALFNAAMVASMRLM
jgi:hypothetical protein